MNLLSKLPFVGYGVGLIWVLADCHPSRSPSDPSVEKQYLDDLLHCVETAQTRDQADECRDRVDSKYEVHRGR